MSDTPSRSDEWGSGWSHAFLLRYHDGSHSFYPNHRTNDLSHVKVIMKIRRLEDPPLASDFTWTEWNKMGKDIILCTSLTMLSLEDCNLNGSSSIGRGSVADPKRVESTTDALFGELKTFCPLDALIMKDNKLGGYCGADGLAALLPFVKYNAQTLVYLDLSNTGLRDDAARMLAGLLDDDLRVKSLRLNENSIGDGIINLLSAKNIEHVETLLLHDQHAAFGNRGNGARHARRAILSFLGRDTALMHFGIDEKDRKHACKMIESISKNSNLEEFEGSIGTSSKQCRELLVPVLEKLLCDTSSFDSLCQSNHNLWKLGTHTSQYSWCPDDEILKHALEINMKTKYGVSKGQKLRSKLRSFYFTGDYDVQPFIDMDTVLMPKVLQIVTLAEVCVNRGDHGYMCDCDECENHPRRYYEVPGNSLNPVYRMVRHCQVEALFGYPSPDAKISSLEAHNIRLKEKNERLMAEIAELRSQLSSMPNKRSKASK